MLLNIINPLFNFAQAFELRCCDKIGYERTAANFDDTVSTGYLLTRTLASYVLQILFLTLLMKIGDMLPVVWNSNDEHGTGKDRLSHLNLHVLYASNNEDFLLMA